MRILFATKVQLDQPFGGSRHVLAVCRELAALGHELALIGPGADPPLPGVRRIVPPSRFRAGLRLEAVMAAMIASELRARRPDVVYLRLSPTSSLIPLTVLAHRIPLVLELNGPILDELRATGRGSTAVRTVGLTLSAIVRRSDALIAASKSVATHAERFLGARAPHVVLNGADLELATPGDRHEARSRLGLSDQRYLTFVGTLVPEQRIDLLLAAHGRLDGVTLLIAGGGPRTPEVEAHRSANVRFFGPVPHARAIDLIRAADICVSTRAGDLGMKPLEYAAVGRRFVLFEEDGIDRLTSLYSNEEAVFPVREKTVEALAAALRSAFDADARRGPLPLASIERARAAVGWNRTAREIASILEPIA